ncbi:hypothetical protein AB0H83_31850 [Dactylosporangium sp. NPDC050688]|uniref:hypothetical protein n=1 Tax=Dactylosporangium sp. NPDC050688 TaxID=3157217 RepID=UPI0033E8D2E9
MNEHDDEIDAWLHDINEGIVESLTATVDTEAALLQLKQNAAKEAVAVAHNRGSDEPDRAIREVLAVKFTAGTTSLTDEDQGPHGDTVRAPGPAPATTRPPWWRRRFGRLLALLSALAVFGVLAAMQLVSGSWLSPPPLPDLLQWVSSTAAVVGALLVGVVAPVRRRLQRRRLQRCMTGLPYWTRSGPLATEDARKIAQWVLECGQWTPPDSIHRLRPIFAAYGQFHPWPDRFLVPESDSDGKPDDAVDDAADMDQTALVGPDDESDSPPTVSNGPSNVLIRAQDRHRRKRTGTTARRGLRLRPRTPRRR